MTPNQPSDWRSLAEQATKEKDHEKLMDVVAELDRVLGEREETSRQKRHDQGPSRGETS